MVMLMLDVDTDADTKTDIYADAGCLVRLDGGPPSTLKKRLKTGSCVCICNESLRFLFKL